MVRSPTDTDPGPADRRHPTRGGACRRFGGPLPSPTPYSAALRSPRCAAPKDPRDFQQSASAATPADSWNARGSPPGPQRTRARRVFPLLAAPTGAPAIDPRDLQQSAGVAADANAWNRRESPTQGPATAAAQPPPRSPATRGRFATPPATCAYCNTRGCLQPARIARHGVAGAAPPTGAPASPATDPHDFQQSAPAATPADARNPRGSPTQGPAPAPADRLTRPRAHEPHRRRTPPNRSVRGRSGTARQCFSGPTWYSNTRPAAALMMARAPTASIQGS